MQSTDGAEQAAPIISQAPSASWTWENEVIPFSGVPAWVMVGPATTLLLFVAFLHHEAGHKDLPKDHHQKTAGHGIVTLTWKEA